MRDHQIISRIIQPAEPPRSFGTVQGVLPDGRYTVLLDDQARKVTVDGARGSYIPGNQVEVQAGRIVGFGSRPPIRKTIRV